MWQIIIPPTTSKNSTATPPCSTAPPSSTSPSVHLPPAPITRSSKLPAEPQPMDLDCMKSKNLPQTCYNCNKPGHIACNCPEPHTHQVHNTDILSPETIQAITEAVKIAIGGNTVSRITG